jgi:peptidoglycan/LPS O-acetylase OafA/YrhL
MDLWPPVTRRLRPVQRLAGNGVSIPIHSADKNHPPPLTTQLSAADVRYRTVKYVPGLDGLRAIAVLTVAFGHFGVRGFTGLAFGVDIFFVLSGFLITKVVLVNAEKGRGLSDFYLHRFVRLAPPLALVCSALFLLPETFLSRYQAWRDVISSGLYISNWTHAFPVGAPEYMAHSWSLSIEEQFYLLWPILLLNMKRLGDTMARWGSVALLILSLGWLAFMYCSGASFDRIYNGFDTHSGGLLCGCCLALFAFPRLPGWMGIVALAGYAALVEHFAWNAPLVPIVWIAAAVLILEVSNESNKTILKRVLNWRPFVWIGLISYSLYLWHYPVVLVLEYHLQMPTRIAAPLGIAVSIALAALTYVAVESPCRRARDAMGPAARRRLGGAAAAWSVTGMAVGIWFFWGDTLVNMIF